MCIMIVLFHGEPWIQPLKLYFFYYSKNRWKQSVRLKTADEISIFITINASQEFTRGTYRLYFPKT